MASQRDWSELTEAERRCAMKHRYKHEPPLPSMMFRAYKCPFCEGWHLASKYKRRDKNGSFE
jgi:hypothetical protein